MFDRDFFETLLSKHVTEKAKFGDGSAAVKVRLSTGETLSVMRLIEAHHGYVIVEPYPHDGKLRPHSKQNRKVGAPQYDFDRVALAYEIITDVLVTARPQRNQKLGFQPST